MEKVDEGTRRLIKEAVRQGLVFIEEKLDQDSKEGRLNSIYVSSEESNRDLWSAICDEVEWVVKQVRNQIERRNN